MAENTGYAIGNNKWFLGQVPPCQNQHAKSPVWKDAHGDRVKVRIPGYHPMSSTDEEKELVDDELPWAIVAQPTTSGNRSKQSTGIWGGEWVFGFFMDEDCQIPVITNILGNNLNGYSIRKSDGNTKGKRVDMYNCGRQPNPAELTGGNNPGEQAKPTSSDFDAAKVNPKASVKNEDGATLAVKLDSWDGGRNKITEKDFNTVYNSPHSSVTKKVKRDATRAALNSGIITNQQFQRRMSRLKKQK